MHFLFNHSLQLSLMKKNISVTFLLLCLFSIMYTSCHDFNNNDSSIAIINPSYPLAWRIDSSSLTSSQIDSIDLYVVRIHNASNSAIRTIANSSYTDSELDTLSEALLAGIFTASELVAITDTIDAARSYLNSLIGGESCGGCSYTASETVDIIRIMAQEYRDDPDDFDLKTDPKKRKFGDNLV